ncbi:uncharacterized protein LOC129589834 [Paramacrobiotus metropolitanus]|uniref:uncharacterized protein LOC129589834 n=1 Tax=Paramacrobiotus metropolitanus TaxID=2943436 RepID=UPI0024458350|nr:uncharacterized protein LOC129589834 [Paramacrobiotus metropolitanus]
MASLFRNGFRRYSVEFCLFYLSLLAHPGTGIIQVYEKRFGEVSSSPICSIYDDHQAVVGAKLPVDRSVFVVLEIAIPSTACDLFSSYLRRGAQRKKTILLMDDTECPAGNVWGNNGYGTRNNGSFYAKIIKAQDLGYVGAIVYPGMSAMRQWASFNRSDPDKPITWLSRSTARPIPLPDKMAKVIRIPVHFVSYQQTVLLEQYKDRSFATLAGFHFNLTSPARATDKEFFSGSQTYEAATNRKSSYVYPDRTDIFGLQRRPAATQTTRTTPAYQYYLHLLTPSPYIAWSDYARIYSTPAPIQLYPTVSSRYRSRSTSSDLAYLALAIPIGVLFALMRYACDKRRKQQAVSRFARTIQIHQRLTDEEVAQVMAAREEIVRRLIFTLIAQAQEAEERQRLTASSTPLSAGQMEQLPRTEITGPSDDICPTCQQNFTEGELKIVLPCTHVGHEACLTTWLTTYSCNCPVCRQPVFEDHGTAESATIPTLVLAVDTRS